MLGHSSKSAVQVAPPRTRGYPVASLRDWKRIDDNPLEGCINPDKLKI